jgi:acyl-CoA hydrolase
MAGSALPPDEQPVIRTPGGRTSMHIHFTARHRSRAKYVHEKVTCATFGFVASDAEGQPRLISR